MDPFESTKENAVGAASSSTPNNTSRQEAPAIQSQQPVVINVNFNVSSPTQMQAQRGNAGHYHQCWHPWQSNWPAGPHYSYFNPDWAYPSAPYHASFGGMTTRTGRENLSRRERFHLRYPPEKKSSVGEEKTCFAAFGQPSKRRCVYEPHCTKWAHECGGYRYGSCREVLFGKVKPCATLEEQEKVKLDLRNKRSRKRKAERRKAARMARQSENILNTSESKSLKTAEAEAETEIAHVSI